MEILLACDDNYAPLCGITIQSVLENNGGEINFHVMDNGISLKNKNKILSIIDEFDYANLEFIEHKNVDEILDVDIKATRALSTYSRLLCASYLSSSIDKIIYMDCDALVDDSLNDLWNTDISDYYFGAVLDVNSKNVNRHLNLEESNPHFNAGFLLINLKRWREENLEEKFLDFIIENDGEVFHNDQGILNVVCNHQILKIHPKYNLLSPFLEKSYEDVLKFFDTGEYYSKETVNEAVSNPVFMHLTKFLNGQPWHKDAVNHPVRKLFEKYASHTPFMDDEIYVEVNYDSIWKTFLRLSKILPWSLVCFLFKSYQKLH